MNQHLLHVRETRGINDWSCLALPERRRIKQSEVSEGNQTWSRRGTLFVCEVLFLITKLAFSPRIPAAHVVSIYPDERGLKRTSFKEAGERMETVTPTHRLRNR